MSNGRYSLYGTSFSLFTGKVRAYLRKKGIPEISDLWVEPAHRSVLRLLSAARAALTAFILAKALAHRRDPL